jgi:hypothetical protein
MREQSSKGSRGNVVELVKAADSNSELRRLRLFVAMALYAVNDIQLKAI